MNLVPSIARLVLCRLGWLFRRRRQRDAEILAPRSRSASCNDMSPDQSSRDDRTILAVLSTVRSTGRAAGSVPDRATGHRDRVAPPPSSPDDGLQPAAPDEGGRRCTPRSDVLPFTWPAKTDLGLLAHRRRTVLVGPQSRTSGVWKILRDAGIDPTPNRTGPTRAQFIDPRRGGDRHRLLLRRHRHPPRLPRPVLHRGGIQTVHLAGITTNPTAR